MSDVELTGENLYETWRPQGSPILLWSELTDDVKARWNILADQLSSRHLVPRRMIYGAVRNYVANELGMSRDVIAKIFHDQIKGWAEGWLRSQMSPDWAREVIRGILSTVVRDILRDKVNITVSPTVNVEIRP